MTHHIIEYLYKERGVYILNLFIFHFLYILKILGLNIKGDA